VGLRHHGANEYHGVTFDWLGVGRYLPVPTTFHDREPEGQGILQEHPAENQKLFQWNCVPRKQRVFGTKYDDEMILENQSGLQFSSVETFIEDREQEIE